jgi:acyl homoserine lactone synthase
MVVLYIVNPDNREVFREDLDAYFRLRKRVLIDQKGWDLKSENGKEMDQFDHDQAHYLIYKSAGKDTVSAGVRLTPTLAQNLTLDIFSHMIDSRQGFLASPKVWESSRFVAETLETTSQINLIKEATFMLFIGMIEYGLRHNFHSILTMTEVRLERIGRMYQWYLKRLGGVEKVGNTYAVTGLLEVSEAMREKMRKNSNIFKDVFWNESPGLVSRVQG